MLANASAASPTENGEPAAADFCQTLALSTQSFSYEFEESKKSPTAVLKQVPRQLQCFNFS